MIVAGLLLLLASSFTSCNPIPLLDPVINTDFPKLALMFRLFHCGVVSPRYLRTVNQTTLFLKINVSTLGWFMLPLMLLVNLNTLSFKAVLPLGFVRNVFV